VLFLSESPVDDVDDRKVLPKRMFHAQTHAADNADGDCVFVLAQLCTFIAFHDASPYQV
jgi:hypothetical protein